MKSSRGFIAPLLLALIAILLVGGGASWYLTHNSAQQSIFTGPSQTPSLQVTKVSSDGTKLAIAYQHFPLGTEHLQVCLPNDGGCTTWRSTFSPQTSDGNFTAESNVHLNQISRDNCSDCGLPAKGFFQLLAVDDNGKMIAESDLFTVSQNDSPAAVNTASISVPGMGKYTDTDFGFSFWYPSGWTVTTVPVQSPDANGWFQDGSLIKELNVHSPNSQQAVNIEEFRSSSLAITELGQTKSASPVGVDQKYFFDTNAHTWMYENLTDAPSGNRKAGTITAADVSNNTMGGLHIFVGAVRFGDEVIIPLSTKNFILVSEATETGGQTFQPLAKTIVATDPSAATPVSDAEQIQTIQAEAEAYAGK